MIRPTMREKLIGCAALIGLLAGGCVPDSELAAEARVRAAIQDHQAELAEMDDLEDELCADPDNMSDTCVEWRAEFGR